MRVGSGGSAKSQPDLKSHEYSVPVLGLIFLRYADHKFALAKAKLTGQTSGRRTTGKADYQARCVLYLPEKARFSALLDLPEGTDIAKAINDAMRAIEADNEDLKGVLPKTYTKFDKTLLVSLLKNFAAEPTDIQINISEFSAARELAPSIYEAGGGCIVEDNLQGTKGLRSRPCWSAKR